MFYIVESFDNYFLTNRRSTGDRYKARSDWSKELDDAKIFSTQAAATRSAKDNGEKGFWVTEANFTLGNVVKTVSIDHD